jgi:hypothetical protein
MKPFIGSAVSIMLASILFCPVVTAAPAMPDDVQIVRPDPSLPRELSAFWGKWEGNVNYTYYFIIVEKIDAEKATLYIWRGGTVAETAFLGWQRIETNVIKEQGKYKLWWNGPIGNNVFTLEGKYLDWYMFGHHQGPRLRRAP